MVRMAGWLLAVMLAGGALPAGAAPNDLAGRQSEAERQQAQLRDRIENLQKDIDAREAARKEAADALIPPGEGPILAIGPGVDWIGKRWPADRYAKVALSLLGEDGPLAGGRLMIVGEEADRDAAHSIRFAVKRERVIELQGRLTRLQTVAALSRADLYIGGDSLWTQLAVAAGVPAVGVFGPSDETLRRPWTGVAVRGPRSLQEFIDLDPRLNQHIQHMMDLPYERVLKASRKLLAQLAE